MDKWIRGAEELKWVLRSQEVTSYILNPSYPWTLLHAILYLVWSYSQKKCLRPLFPHNSTAGGEKEEKIEEVTGKQTKGNPFFNTGVGARDATAFKN